MFKIGDMVRITNIDYEPLIGCYKAVGSTGKIVQISELGNYRVGVSGYWASELSLEHVSTPGAVATAQASDYPSVCPCCGQKAYVSLIGLVDCSSSSCPTKDPNHRKHYS